MRLAGRTIKGPNIVVIAIPRGDGQDIILRAQAIMDYEPFNKLCQRPKPPRIIRKGGIEGEDPTNPIYQTQVKEWASARTNWMILKSLEATTDLVWDTVNIEDPNTWINLDKEFEQAGFTAREIDRVMDAVLEANGLDENKMEEARQRFLASERVPQ